MENSNSTVGQIKIADEVIAIIAGTAASEVDGVVPVSHITTDTISGIFGKKNLAKGVKVSVEDGEAAIEMEIAVKFGVNIKESAETVQAKVKNAVETMTGLTVSAVDVTVSAVIVEKDKYKEEKDAE